jgi:hypothetical protein
MLKWLVSLLASSFTFAVADVLCDICIDEQHDDDEPPPRVETAADESDDDASASPAGKRDGERGGIEMLRLRGSGDAKYVAVADATPSAAARDDDKAKEQGVQLTGEQDAAIAGLVTIFGLGVSLCYWSATSPGGQVLGLGSSNAPTALSSLKWGPSTHVQFWFAMLGGAMAFLHYYFLLKAFEGAPSTVLLPLVQVASVSVLLGSSVVAALRSEPWITPVHALAYVLMFVGGILPACAGDLHALLQPAFWRQSFVIFAIAAEFALGLHDLMLSGCAYDSERNVRAEAAALGGTPAEEESVESFEFFVWSRCSFVATFIGMYALSPRLNEQLSALFSGAVASKYVILSAISEGLTILGFYLASIAYGARAARPPPPRPPPPTAPTAAAHRARAASRRAVLPGGHRARGGGEHVAAAQPDARVPPPPLLRHRPPLGGVLDERQDRLLLHGDNRPLPLHVRRRAAQGGRAAVEYTNTARGDHRRRLCEMR